MRNSMLISAFASFLGLAIAQGGAPTLWAYKDAQCFTAESPANYNFPIPLSPDGCLNVPPGFNGYEVQLHPDSSGRVPGYDCSIVAYPSLNCQGTRTSPVVMDGDSRTGCIGPANPNTGYTFTAYSIEFLC